MATSARICTLLTPAAYFGLLLVLQVGPYISLLLVSKLNAPEIRAPPNTISQPEKAFVNYACEHRSLTQISDFDKALLTVFVLKHLRAEWRWLLLSQCTYSSRCGVVCWSLQRQGGILTLPARKPHVHAHPNTHFQQTFTVTLPVYSLCPMAFLTSLQRMYFLLKLHLFHILPLPLVYTMQTLS